MKLTHVEHGHDRLQDVVRVEVHNVGRQPAVLRSVQLGKLVQIPATPHTPIYESTYDFEVFPDSGDHARLIAPTDFVQFDISFETAMKHWGPGVKLSLKARAKRGDGKEIESNVLGIRTPTQV